MSRSGDNKHTFTKKTMAILLAAGIGLFAAGGSLAYYSATSDVKRNSVSVVVGEQNKADAAILTETFNKSAATKCQPNSTAVKAPVVHNTQNYPAYCIVKVTVPTITGRMSGDTADKVYDMFNLYTGTIAGDSSTTTNQNSSATVTNQGTVFPYTTAAAGSSTGLGAKWKLVQKTISTTAGTNSVYYFAYDGSIDPAGSTSAVFNVIGVPDFTRTTASTAEASGNIDVKAALVQTVGYKNPCTDTTTRDNLIAALQ